MTDKLRRARHTRTTPAQSEREARSPRTPQMPLRTPDMPHAGNSTAASHMYAPGETGAIPVIGSHAGVDRTAAAPAKRFAPGETGAIPVVGSHAGIDRTASAHDAAPAKAAASPLPRTHDGREERAVQRGRHAARQTRDDRIRAQEALEAFDATSPADAQIALDDAPRTDAQVGASAALISICTIISRITGFARTWAMAFALGATFVSSSYQVANNLPNMLYELVMGGLLSTAFLPVYVSIKKQQGKKVSEEYASNLLTLVIIGLGVVSALSMIFPAQVIYTQTFYSNQEEMDLSVFFFQFFAIQIVFYGVASIVSGLLNANRDYFWGAFAPVLNNVVVIATFLAYAFVAPHNQAVAFLIIAIGNPLGVFVQMAVQIPALKRNGIRLRPRISLRDPAIRETVSLGLPAILVTVCSFVTVSVGNAASYCFADNGPSVIAYSRLWFTFPYSFLAVPVSTAMFTELSSMQAENDTKGVVRGIMNGSTQIFFLMIPFALYLIVYATPLVTLYHMGAFTADRIAQIASYLCVMAVALPFYGVNSYLQMACSSIRRMRALSVITLVASAAQVGVIAAGAWGVQNGMPIPIESIAVGTIVSYVVADVLIFAYLRHVYGRMGMGGLIVGCLRALGLGAAGAAAGAGVLMLLETCLGPLNGSIAQAFGYVVASGIVSLLVTFGPAIALKLPEAAFLTGIVAKAAGKLKRA